MSFQKQVAALFQDLANKQKLIQVTIKSLNLQSSRASALLARYKGQTSSSDGIFKAASIKDPSFKQLDQYSNLISKQFCSQLIKLRDSYLRVKVQLQRLDDKIKKKPQQSDNGRIISIRNTLKPFQAEFLAIWEEQHYLVLNYRLDNAAKELERWTAVMETNKKSQETIAQTISGLFS